MNCSEKDLQKLQILMMNDRQHAKIEIDLRYIFLSGKVYLKYGNSLHSCNNSEKTSSQVVVDFPSLGQSQ